MQTSDPAIYAAGDAVEVEDLVDQPVAAPCSAAQPTARAGSRPITSFGPPALFGLTQVP